MIKTFQKLTYIINQHQNRLNVTQAAIRAAVSILFVSASVYLQLTSYMDYSAMLLISMLHLPYALFSLYKEYRDHSSTPARKVMNTTVDHGILSLFIYAADTSAAFVYPFMLWIIVGTGMRYGIKYLYISLAIAALFFYLATKYNPAWDSHYQLNISMILGMIILPLLYSSLIKKIHMLNNSLETKVQERTKQLKYRLFDYTLTKLRNRAAFKSDMTRHKEVLIYLIDIDKFRNYNDLYGMESGNVILQECAHYLRKIADEHNCLVYRIYADGFLLSPQDEYVLDSEEQYKLTIDILTHLSTFTTSIDNIPIDFTVACVSGKKQLLEKADAALKYAKKTGKNFITYNNTMDNKKEIENGIYWKNEIKKAIEYNNIIPFFQPIVDINGNVIKYESLIRLKQFKNGEEKIVSPFFFLDIAMKTRQYEKLTSIMIDKSFTFMEQTKQQFSINFSFADIKSELIVNLLKAKILRHHVGEQLIIEIVESEAVEDFAIVKNFVDNFRKLGVRFAIDDFGSGYSNYANILEIKPDYIKIDGSLIKNVDQDKEAYKLVKSIVFLAKNLGIKTIAEYIHSKEVFEVSKKLGIDEFQGFYFAPPLTEAAVLSREKIKQ